jgi:hypothetical protein
MSETSSESGIAAAAEGSTPLKPWRDRANTIGYLPGSMAGQTAILREVLAQLPCHGKSKLVWIRPNGEEASAVCEELCLRQLSTAGLAERAANNCWAPSKAALEWLKNDDAEFLATYLHGNVKFFGELLASIGSDTSHTDLLRIAQSFYGISWTTPDQVRRRTGWLRSLGMVETWGQKVKRTSLGDALLQRITICPSEEALGNSDNDGPDEIEDAEVQAFVTCYSDLDQESLRGRRSLIGYIPRGRNSTGREAEDPTLTPTAAVRKLVITAAESANLEEFVDNCSQELGINKSSFNSTLHTLRHMGLIEQTALNVFSPTDCASWLVEPGNEKALIAYLHTRYCYFGEILVDLEPPSSASQLTKVAKEQYGYHQASNVEIRLRLGFLQDAGLVERVDWHRFRITAAGRSFAPLLSLQRKVPVPELAEEDSAEAELSSSDRLEIMTEDLAKLSRDGTESRAFEIVVGESFRFLGFGTEHLGGPGQTDVLALAELAPKDRYRVIIDAKTSASGLISESAINFNVLSDHKKKHKADHVVVVGPDFANRLKDWAVDHGVVLLAVDDLVAMLERHAANPISLVDLRDTFTRVDTHKDETLELYQRLERRSLLARKILELAFQEAVDQDPIAGGFISPENITYALRKEFSPRPSSDEIRESLVFLSDPLVAALGVEKGTYKLADSPHNVSLRMHGLGEILRL